MRYVHTGIHLLGMMCLLWLGFIGKGSAQNARSYHKSERWADSLLYQMTLKEKIGQLFMVAAYSKPNQQNNENISYLIRNFKVGGIIFMQGTPEEQAKLTNQYQASSEIPLLVGQDAEWGLSMRLPKTMRFPKNLTLGAIRDDSLLYEMGMEMGLELHRLGVHLNFAPVVDINNNPLNPVINDRSFGENKYRVSRKGLMLSKGLEEMGVMPCIKHFPGHGDTDTDSHHALPVMNQTRERLDTLELYPFASLVRAGIPAVMAAHLHIPNLDSTQNLPASLSPKIIKGILRDSLNFDGLVFTDALNMQGVAHHFNPGEVSVKALQAGVDVLLMPENITRSFEAIQKALDTGDLTEKQIDTHVKRILLAKYKLGLTAPYRVSTDNLIKDLNPYEAELLRKKLYESALTLAKNQDQALPLENLENRKIAYIQIGGSKDNLFERTLRKYADIDVYYLPRSFSANDRLKLLKETANYNTLITGLFDMSAHSKHNYGLNRETLLLCEKMAQRNATSILTIFGSPYSLQFFGQEDAILVAYEPAKEPQRAAAAAIFGGLRVDGRLPITASPQFREGTGEIIATPIRFGFSYPEEKGLHGPTLGKIDSLVNYYIQRKAMPGCAVLVVKNNDIVYEKGFGLTQPYGMSIDPYFHIYDLASITKIAATTLSVMRLVDQGRLNLDRAISYYLPELRGTGVGTLTARRLLQHTAGLPGWVPFYRDTYKNARQTQLDPFYYSVRPTLKHETRIGPRLYLNSAVQDSIWEHIKSLPVRRTTRMRYSDVGMIIMARVVETVTRQSLDDFAQYNFYRPLGMSETLFNPALQGWQDRCPPTERDDYWRFNTIKGYVHDPASALMGGVSGHAGLFANVYDLAKLMLMLKNDGRYGGRFYIKGSTIREFTKQQLSSSRRGLGFDKPEVFRGRSNPVSEYASPHTFGHTGFTGTCVWADPQHDLVYVFLSNRTFPTQRNTTLIRENVRTKIMDTLYEAMFRYNQGIASNEYDKSIESGFN